MMRPFTRLSAALVALATLGACGGEILRYDIPPQAETGRIPVSVSRVEVLDVSLPLYASQEVIYVETPEGALVADTDLLWADDPQRSITEGLAYALAAKTPAVVAAEPWPFFDRPEARLDVRFSRALAQSDGMYVIAGQYFVAGGEEGRDVARRFRLSARWAEPGTEPTRSAIAAAQGRVVDELATLIARDGL